MTAEDDIFFLKAREAEERDAAEQSSCMVRDVHLEAADLYAERAEALEKGQAAPGRDRIAETVTAGLAWRDLQRAGVLPSVGGSLLIPTKAPKERDHLI